MKKTLLTLLVLAGMAPAVAASNPISLPGFKKPAQAQRHVENRQMPAVALPTAKFVTPPKATMLQAPAGMEYVDRLIKEDVTLGSTKFSKTFEYDEYGFPKKWTSSDGFYTTYDYTWQDPGKIWASKEVRAYNADGNLAYVESDIKRTFYPDGAVKTSTVRENGGDNFVIYEYDNDGNLIKQTESRFGGEISITSYTYFPLLDSWLESRETPGEKTIVTLDGNNGFITEGWRLENDNVWRKNHETGHWYNQDGDEIGYMDLWYYTDRVQGYGNKIIIEENDNSFSDTSYRLKEENGDVILTDGNVTWIPEYKNVYSRNYSDPWVYNAGEVRTIEAFDYENNQWVASDKETYTWVKDNVVKKVREDYEDEDESYTSYYRVLEDGKLDNNFYYDETTGNYAIYEWDSEYQYYTYYDAAGNVISKFREEDQRYGVPTYEQWVNGAWSKCTGTITLYEDSSCSYIITFDEQGRIVSEEEYESGRLDDRTEYTYTANGHVKKRYEPMEGSNQLYLAYEDRYTTEGNIVTNIYFYYSEDGSIEYGSKSVKDKEKQVTYNYNYSNGEWILGYTYVEPIEEILADGTRIRIEREMGADGNIINTRKYVDLETPDRRLSECYEWNVERNDWDGAWKNETVKINIKPFAVIAPVSPEIFEDEYFFPVNDENDVENVSNDWYPLQWQWDHSINAWVCLDYAPEYTYPDEYTQIVKYRGHEWERSETIKVDNERRMIENSFVETMYDQTTMWKQLWEYDQEGRIVSAIEHRTDNETWSYYYTYGPIEVLGVEDVISAAATKVTVYNPQGICVLRDAAPEAVTTLPQGLYIINGKKVAIR